MNYHGTSIVKKSLERHSLYETPCQNNIVFKDTELPGVLEVHYVIHKDDRGHLCKPYERSAFAKQNLDWFFPAESLFSYSEPNVLRGMHYQSGCAKLVWIVGPGHVTDVALSVNRFSSSYGQYAVFELYEGKGLFIGPGYAHGFCVMGDAPVCFHYMTNVAWNPDQEAGVYWGGFGMNWPIKDPIISAKDAKLPLFGEHEW